MARLILIIAAIAAVWWLLRRLLPRQPGGPPSDQERGRFTPTVRCHVCGAYLDRRLARHDDAGYCCDSHDESS